MDWCENGLLPMRVWERCQPSNRVSISLPTRGAGGGPASLGSPALRGTGSWNQSSFHCVGAPVPRMALVVTAERSQARGQRPESQRQAEYCWKQVFKNQAPWGGKNQETENSRGSTVQLYSWEFVFLIPEGRWEVGFFCCFCRLGNQSLEKLGSR